MRERARMRRIISGVGCHWMTQGINVERRKLIALVVHRAIALRAGSAFLVCEYFVGISFLRDKLIFFCRSEKSNFPSKQIGRFTCDARNLIPPTASPITDSPTGAPAVAGPSKFPTYSPIGPPDPLPFPSQDLTGKISHVMSCFFILLASKI